MSVTLRKRKLNSGRIQLYLDIYRYGQRKTEALQMFLDGDRFHNRETVRMAETIRAKRELDVQAELHGLTASYNRKSSFIKYMTELKEKKRTKSTRYTWGSVISRLSDFAGNTIVFGDLTQAFVQNYSEY